MDCKETQKHINEFLSDHLDDDITEEFMQHVTECKECMEELTIQYLVTEGLQRLETASAFDAQRELEEKLEAAMARRRMHKRIKIGMFIGGVIIAIALICVGAYFMMY